MPSLGKCVKLEEEMDLEVPYQSIQSTRSYRRKTTIHDPKLCAFLDESDEYDVNELILRANAPPDHSNASLDEIMNQMKARRYYMEQFRRIQEQTGIHPFLLRFSSEYEAGYHHFNQKRCLKRVRFCLILALFSLTGFFLFAALDGKYDSSSNSHSKKTEQIIYILSFGCTLPLLGICFGLTFCNFMKAHMEKMSAFVFVWLSLVLIIKKALLEEEGPILPLFLLLIPVFGITRMRFLMSCAIGWLIFFMYLIVLLFFAADSTSSVIYQSVNYAISIIGGLVSQYRQELLRRRNYALRLPFNGLKEEDNVHHHLQKEQFSKRALMYSWSCSFRHPQVEETFYRFWYLIDPFPYEHANAGILHQGVFRVLRFAIMGLALNQAVLGIQDSNFLDGENHTIAIILRYGLVVPAYISAGVFLYFIGKAFYYIWMKEAEMQSKASAPRPSYTSDSHVRIDVLESPLPELTKSFTTKSRTKSIISNSSSHSNASFFMSIAQRKGGYVRSAQIYAATVIGIHCAAMGTLLLVVTASGTRKPVYFMGYLNAILFAHRSGFRVRFIYATHTTGLVTLLFIAMTAWVEWDVFFEYATYNVIVLVLGMMISHEEENLRRTFFILKSIRLLEFDEWFTTVLRIQGWVRQALVRRVEQAKGKVREKKGLNVVEPEALTNTSGHMAKASKYGVVTQAANMMLAAVSELG